MRDSSAFYLSCINVAALVVFVYHMSQIEQREQEREQREQEREQERDGERKLLLHYFPFMRKPWDKCKIKVGLEANVPKRPRNIKTKSAKFYFENMNVPDGRFKCLVTGKIGVGDEVKLAHIIPRRSPDQFFKYICLDPNDRDQPRNTMLLADKLESAFDNMQISFCETPESIECTEARERQYRVMVWDQNILNKSLWPGSQYTVEDFQGHVFSFPPGKEPFTRLLSWQAQDSYDNAVKLRWVSKKECKRPPKFGTPVREVFTTPIDNWISYARGESPQADEKQFRGCQERLFQDEVSTSIVSSSNIPSTLSLTDEGEGVSTDDLETKKTHDKGAQRKPDSSVEELGVPSLGKDECSESVQTNRTSSKRSITNSKRGPRRMLHHPPQDLENNKRVRKLDNDQELGTNGMESIQRPVRPLSSSRALTRPSASTTHPSQKHPASSNQSVVSKGSVRSSSSPSSQLPFGKAVGKRSTVDAGDEPVLVATAPRKSRRPAASLSSNTRGQELVPPVHQAQEPDFEETQPDQDNNNNVQSKPRTSRTRRRLKFFLCVCFCVGVALTLLVLVIFWP